MVLIEASGLSRTSSGEDVCKQICMYVCSKGYLLKLHSCSQAGQTVHFFCWSSDESFWQAHESFHRITVNSCDKKTLMALHVISC